MEAPNLLLKLFIDTKSNKVLFTEAGKDFVDLIFYFISLPVSTVVRLLNKKSQVGCLDDLYAGIENLSDTYMQKDRNKECLLNPKAPISCNEIPCLLSDLKSSKVYHCHFCCNSDVAYAPQLRCRCSNVKHAEIIDVVSHVAGGKSNNNDSAGFVKSMVTYMVMDNLEVTDNSAISLLKKFNVKEVNQVEERVVQFGPNEVLKLIKASMECKTVLTSVFLGNKDKKFLKVKDEPQPPICGSS
ncbi:hypothetical protein Dsin_004133 [Dipteronia sinensis]|uniref:DUF674 domain-containing protein n=1 Tax=Dipteronia sinensis TaxID=43782 RepID=A0AAE0ELL0_9ROSI|nr:hypothetical protein Dsin_004133 [Dipteronia sinensis]